ncbi:MAG: response regulator [Myxococcales bacterium]|nr:response regulator [Myxococcales bacterium]
MDDEADVRLLVLVVLSRAGYEVLLAEDGVEALETLKANPVDLLLIDKNLPRMSGLAFLQEARRLFPDIPAVIITASPEAFFSSQEKFEVYLPKPFRNLKALEQAVRDAFEISHVAQERRELQRKLAEVVAHLKPAKSS